MKFVAVHVLSVDNEDVKTMSTVVMVTITDERLKSFIARRYPVADFGITEVKITHRSANTIPLFTETHLNFVFHILAPPFSEKNEKKKEKKKRKKNRVVARPKGGEKSRLAAGNPAGAWPLLFKALAVRLKGILVRFFFLRKTS